MTKLLFASTAALLLMATAVPVHADDVFIAEQKLTEYLAKDRLIGAKVHDKDGKIVGDIEDLIVTNDNQIVGVIMGVGGLLGLGEKKVGISNSALSIESTDGKMNVVMPSATKELIEAAPAYKRVKPPKGWLQRAVEKGEEFKDKGSVTAKDAYEAAKQKAGPALEKAKEAAKEVIDQAREAAKPTEAAAPAPSTASAGDDFLRIRGIDEGSRDRLHGLGVNTFKQIAEWTQADVSRIEEQLGASGRIARENWMEQAKILSEGGDTAYSRERAKKSAP